MNHSAESTAMPASLEEVIADFLQSKSNQTPSVYLQRFPQWAAELQAFFDDQQRFRAFAKPLRAAISKNSVAAGAVVGKYHIQEELARGGMGVIFCAVRDDLPRPVALKMLRAGTLADDVDKQRFRFETEAVARLDHPNIVPIYDVGEHEHQPYFTMKIIDGGSLAQRCAEWRLDDGDAAGKAKLRERQTKIAMLIIQVSRAVHYAHSRGILHRDLKPANILLDESGRPYVTDFGLAKLMQKESTTTVTKTGSILGTPSYMSPEQAGGKSSTVSVASDVYSLGAILYELLAGRPPFRGDGPLDVLRQVTNSEPESIRRTHPNVDADLETICMKCLNKDPQRRYAGASELADDLQRFVDGEPILARPVGRWERFARWRRRKPAAALAVGFGILMLLLLFAGGIAFAILQNNHLRQAKEAARQLANQQSETTEARDKADRSFWLAHRAVNEFYLQVGLELKGDAKLHPIRKKFLKRALDYYQSFLEQRGNDKTLKRELAESHTQVGQITTIIGPRSEALHAYKQALSIYTELHRKFPHDADLSFRMASACLSIATEQHALGHDKDARDSFRKAEALFEMFAKRSPDQPRFRSGAALTANNLAVWHRDHGDLDSALEAYRRAISLREKLAADHPKVIGYKGELALAYNNFGVVLAQSGLRKKALAAFIQARNVRQFIANVKRDDPYAQVALAASYRDIGMVHLQMENPKESAAAWKIAFDIRKRMADADPNITLFQSDLAGIYQDLALVHRIERNYAKTVEYYAQAITIWKRLMKIDPKVPFYRHAHAKCDSRVGEIFVLVGQSEDALRCLKQAVQLQRPLVTAHPKHLDYRYELGITLQRWGKGELRRKNPTEAAAVLCESVDVLSIAAFKAPGTINYDDALYHSLRLLAEAYRSGGRYWDAAQTAKRRRLLCNADAKKLFFVAQDLARTAKALQDGKTLGPLEIALRDQIQSEAIATLEQAIAIGFKDFDRLQRDESFKGMRNHPHLQRILRHES